ncbi:hypothetical protein CORC01_10049 [Colletotrichum orchidophilum]|uniref:XPG-I domain-containing protein n=1 Tax=Colletotrichum orchidophilum TaxID=1209926 RepID=A0A1G4AZQ2_9PEZI|nr:uncharacterized protein CORC01_10049 [Colletotrichum orchidophilum]OHE94648.1 hypothetical protein CORC01_10049 [Colletotrichum orchidophilum]
MGIKYLWKLVDPAGIERSLAQWATDHLKQHGRPLRIAIDEAHWRYKNVTDAQEAIIQKQTPGSHPKERAILERTLSLMRLGIHVVFVFDGEHRPHIKRGSKRYRQRESTTALLKNTLDHILVPWLEAPGEAEAECALLQQRGLVDAVWSDDGDCLMFGCTVLIRDLRDNKNQKRKEHARVFDMTSIRRLKVGLYNKKSITFYAMLTGCDYAPDGLPGCGTRLAQELVKDGALVESFWRIQTQEQATQWRTRLQESIHSITRRTNLHFNEDQPKIKNFPDLQALKNCRSPVVSDLATLSRLPFLQREWYGTHTTESLATTIPWMQRYYYSKMSTIWWVRQFTPLVLSQRLLRGEVGTRDLVAKVAQKRKQGPTSSVELDPCRVFPGIERVFIECEGTLLLNRWPGDCELAGSPIENGKFALLDAILGLGMSDTECQSWRKKKRSPMAGTIHPAHSPKAPPPSRMSPGSRFPFTGNLFPANGDILEDPLVRSHGARGIGSGGGTECSPQDLCKLQEKILADCQANIRRTPAKGPQDDSRVGQDKSPPKNRHREWLGTPSLVHKQTKPGTTSLSGRPSLSETAMGATPANPADLRKKRLAKFDAGPSSKERPGCTVSPSFRLQYGNIYSLDEDTPEYELSSAKRRRLEEPMAKDVQAEAPGARGRRMLLEMELESSQDFIQTAPTKAKGAGRCQTAIRESVTGAAGARVGGGDTADDPFEIL